MRYLGRFLYANRCIFCDLRQVSRRTRLMDTQQEHTFSSFSGKTIPHVQGHVKVHISEDETESSAVLPGFSYGDLDRTGDVEPWRAMMLIQAGEDNCLFRGKSQLGKDIFGMAEMLEDKLVFSLSTKLDIMPELYIKKNDFLYDSVIFRQYLNKVGSTSLEIIRELHCQKGYPLVRASQLVVMVNKETHIPMKHSDAYLAKFGKVKPKLIIERFVKDEKPEFAFHTTYQIQWSDADYYGHSNQTSYIRYALNGVTQANVIGHLKNFSKGDLANYKVNCMSMAYTAETKPGDNLDIFLWEDVIIQKRIHCQMEKNGQIVYNTTIDFFDPIVLAKVRSDL